MRRVSLSLSLSLASRSNRAVAAYITQFVSNCLNFLHSTAGTLQTRRLEDAPAEQLSRRMRPISEQLDGIEFWCAPGFGITREYRESTIDDYVGKQ